MASGRRLVDTALLIKAVRTVAKQHLALRSEQFDVWSQTSSIARAVKDNTNRARPARQNANAVPQQSTNSASFQSVSSQRFEGESIPRRETVDSARTESGDKDRTALQQDHHYDRAEENATSDASPTQALGIRQKQAARAATPDGTIPPKEAPLETSPDKEAAGTGNIPEVPEKETIPEQDSVPEGVNTDVFHTPRVKKMLGGQSNTERSRNKLDVYGEKKTPADTSGLANGTDQETFNTRYTSLPSSVPGVEHMKSQHETATKFNNESVENLANDLANDAASSPLQSGTENKPQQEQPVLTNQMRESRVPSSRFGRLWEYGGLATSMAFGAVGETFRRATGGATSSGSLMMSPANLERLVAKLSHMRGAALKLGQMMSFQDSKMLPAPIAQVLSRVQDNADYMPAHQRDAVLASNLGPDWRSLFTSFDEIPMAAASIGQVHRATMSSTGTSVAVKIQYPGVAKSISSDLKNLSVLLTASRLLPKGLFLDKTIANARTELSWECDYKREADCQERFRDLLADETSIYTVPATVPTACGPQVLTAELMTGLGVTKPSLNLTQTQRDWIGTHILRLCMRELTEFRFMQTDPNWTNFLFNPSANKLELLDFGAARDFPRKFTDSYIRLLLAATKTPPDTDKVRDLSIELGYLTGDESRSMLDAHIASVTTLAEPFRDTTGVYDFRDQTVTDRVRALIPVMVRERLSPPPEETYSLHRKLSGAFLLLARLGSRVRCRDLFLEATGKWEERLLAQ